MTQHSDTSSLSAEVWVYDENVSVWLNTETSTVHTHPGEPPLTMEEIAAVLSGQDVVAGSLVFASSTHLVTEDRMVSSGGPVRLDPATGALHGSDGRVVGFFEPTDFAVTPDGYILTETHVFAPDGTPGDAPPRFLSLTEYATSGYSHSHDPLGPLGSLGHLGPFWADISGDPTLPPGFTADDVYIDVLTGDIHLYDPTRWSLLDPPPRELDQAWVDLHTGNIHASPLSDPTGHTLDLEQLADQQAVTEQRVDAAEEGGVEQRVDAAEEGAVKQPVDAAEEGGVEQRVDAAEEGAVEQPVDAADSGQDRNVDGDRARDLDEMRGSVGRDRARDLGERSELARGRGSEEAGPPLGGHVAGRVPEHALEVSADKLTDVAFGRGDERPEAPSDPHDTKADPSVESTGDDSRSGTSDPMPEFALRELRPATAADFVEAGGEIGDRDAIFERRVDDDADDTLHHDPDDAIVDG